MEVGGSDDCDIDIRTSRCEHGRLIACEVVVRVGEVDLDSVGVGLVLTVPGPVVVENRLIAHQNWPAGVAGLLSALEDAVVVEVDLQCHRVYIPRSTGPVGHISNHSERFSGIHLWNNLTAHIAVRVRGVNRSTGWNIEVGTILHRDVPMRPVVFQEGPQSCSLILQGGWVTIPRVGPWFTDAGG